jgi:hypothetical protein
MNKIENTTYVPVKYLAELMAKAERVDMLEAENSASVSISLFLGMLLGAAVLGVFLTILGVAPWMR